MFDYDYKLVFGIFFGIISIILFILSFFLPLSTGIIWWSFISIIITGIFIYNYMKREAVDELLIG